MAEDASNGITNQKQIIEAWISYPPAPCSAAQIPASLAASVSATTAAAARTDNVNANSVLEAAQDLEALIASCSVTREILLPIIGPKPKLTDRLLTRPPFKFLVDLIAAIAKKSGFGRNLFEDDVDTSSMDRLGRRNFMSQVIDLVDLALPAHKSKEQSGLLVEWISPRNIVAGKEALKTNELLQLLGVAALGAMGSFPLCLSISTPFRPHDIRLHSASIHDVVSSPSPQKLPIEETGGAEALSLEKSDPVVSPEATSLLEQLAEFENQMAILNSSSLDVDSEGNLETFNSKREHGDREVTPVSNSSKDSVARENGTTDAPSRRCHPASKSHHTHRFCQKQGSGSWKEESKVRRDDKQLQRPERATSSPFVSRFKAIGVASSVERDIAAISGEREGGVSYSLLPCPPAMAKKLGVNTRQALVEAMPPPENRTALSDIKVTISSKPSFQVENEVECELGGEAIPPEVWMLSGMSHLQLRSNSYQQKGDSVLHQEEDKGAGHGGVKSRADVLKLTNGVGSFVCDSVGVADNYGDERWDSWEKSWQRLKKWIDRQRERGRRASSMQSGVDTSGGSSSSAMATGACEPKYLEPLWVRMQRFERNMKMATAVAGEGGRERLARRTPAVKLTWRDIPWPLDDESALGLESTDTPVERRKKLRKALLFWHPDKFRRTLEKVMELSNHSCGNGGDVVVGHGGRNGMNGAGSGNTMAADDKGSDHDDFVLVLEKAHAVTRRILLEKRAEGL
mmetsp:Transcript_55799/g.111873  ORF Transcript_55799/g.111873 Transcript_55799/m.111873 type:complete len:742 (+) Transcript_55799:12-2237(+)